MKLRPVAVLLPTAALLAGGCGVTQIDQAAAQRFVKQALGDGPRSVKCPSGVEAKPGRTLTCKFVGADGRRYTVVLHIVDGQGRVKFGGADVRPAG